MSEETLVSTNNTTLVSEIKECFRAYSKENRMCVMGVYDTFTKNDAGDLVPYEHNLLHWVIECHIGRNGNGNWLDYFAEIQKVFKELNKKFKRVYLIKWDCDVDDDVSYPIIGISGRKF